ncbi:hypothetical protein JNK13_09535 [bacterium]|nr:hypothetical protein [bacterium]
MNKEVFSRLIWLLLAIVLISCKHTTPLDNANRHTVNRQSPEAAIMPEPRGHETSQDLESIAAEDAQILTDADGRMTISGTDYDIVIDQPEDIVGFGINLSTQSLDTIETKFYTMHYATADVPELRNATKTEVPEMLRTLLLKSTSTGKGTKLTHSYKALRLSSGHTGAQLTFTTTNENGSASTEIIAIHCGGESAWIMILAPTRDADGNPLEGSAEACKLAVQKICRTIEIRTKA